MPVMVQTWLPHVRMYVFIPVNMRGHGFNLLHTIYKSIYTRECVSRQSKTMCIDIAFEINLGVPALFE